MIVVDNKSKIKKYIIVKRCNTKRERERETDRDKESKWMLIEEIERIFKKIFKDKCIALLFVLHLSI